MNQANDDNQIRQKANRINSGEVLAVSDQELDQMSSLLNKNIATIPNPLRVGILDRWLAGPVDSDPIRAYREANGID